MKVLVIGSGGREHALTWGIARSPLVKMVFCAPGNGGTIEIAKNVEIRAGDLPNLTRFSLDEKIDLVVIGPEDPLAAGLADELRSFGINVFGPDATGARIESSKVWSKSMMKRAGVATAQYEAFTDPQAAHRYIDEIGADVVIKANGLAAGKGVVLPADVNEAHQTVDRMLVEKAFGGSGEEIVIEERLEGRELSLIALVDGTDWMLMPPARDHKRAREGNKGPNTGGMGAFAPLPDLTDAQITAMAESVFPPILRQLVIEGIHYRGALYAGMILTNDGAKVLEFNARFGDPEAQAIIPLLSVDLLEPIFSVASGNLSKWMRTHRIQSTDWRRISKGGAAVSVVAASDGYPGDYRKDVKITLMPGEEPDLIPFHAGTKRTGNELVTSGGRVVAVTGLGADLPSAVKRAYQGVERVKFDGMFFRRDIGLKLFEI